MEAWLQRPLAAAVGAFMPLPIHRFSCFEGEAPRRSGAGAISIGQALATLVANYSNVKRSQRHGAGTCPAKEVGWLT